MAWLPVNSLLLYNNIITLLLNEDNDNLHVVFFSISWSRETSYRVMSWPHTINLSWWTGDQITSSLPPDIVSIDFTSWAYNFQLPEISFYETHLLFKNMAKVVWFFVSIFSFHHVFTGKKQENILISLLTLDVSHRNISCTEMENTTKHITSWTIHS